MEYSFVDSLGKIKRINWFDTPPENTDLTGTWIPDVVPVFNPKTHECIKQDPQPVPLQESIVYNIIPKDLAQVKLDKIMELFSAREKDIVKDVSTLNTFWQADERSQKLLSSAITLAQSGLALPPIWRDSFNNNVPITHIGQLLQIAGEIAKQTQYAYSKMWVKKSQVENASTIDEVNAITW